MTQLTATAIKPLINEFDIAFDFGMTKGDAKLVAEAINRWKYGRAIIINHSSFGMTGEDFSAKIKPIMDAAIHDGLISGCQIFLLNKIGNWAAYPELEEPETPNGYWWMPILFERSTLQVSILSPTYRAYRNQEWEATLATWSNPRKYRN